MSEHSFFGDACEKCGKFQIYVRDQPCDAESEELASLRAALAKAEERAEAGEAAALDYAGRLGAAEADLAEALESVKTNPGNTAVLLQQRDTLRAECERLKAGLKGALGANAQMFHEKAELRATLAEREAEIERLKAELVEQIKETERIERYVMFEHPAVKERDAAKDAAAKARKEALEEAREAAERAHVAFLNGRWPDLGDRPSSPPASIEPHWWAIDAAIGALAASDNAGGGR